MWVGTCSDGYCHGLGVLILSDTITISIYKHDETVASLSFDQAFNLKSRNDDVVQAGYEHLLRDLEPLDFKNFDYVSDGDAE